jgi:DNA sulfur modification protein DndC
MSASSYKLFEDVTPASKHNRALLEGPAWLQAYDALVPDAILDLRDRGATFIVNHSGGKDSQSMYAFVRRHIPDAQTKVVHAVLPEVEWDGVIEHIEATIAHELHTCRSRRTLLEMIEERGMFPSPSIRQCTSDLKRGPIERTIRQLGDKLIVNCMGMRAQESSNRSKLEGLKYSERNSKNGREWHEWLPIHAWEVQEVFSMIDFVGQQPHWAYAQGMSRLSCCFCIMASKADLTTAARLNPALYRRYVELERSTGQVMLMPSKSQGRMTLEQVTGVYLDDTPTHGTTRIPATREVTREADTFELAFC